MLDSLFNVLKITVVVAIAAVFMVAITNLVNLIVSLTIGNVAAEIFGIMSCCLPFNASAVFGALFEATVAILSFLIAKKIFDLTSWSIYSI